VNDKAVQKEGGVAFALQVTGDYACDIQVQPDLGAFGAKLESGQSSRAIDFMQVNLRGEEFVSLLPLVRKQAFRTHVKQVCVRLHFHGASTTMMPDAVNDELITAFLKAGYAIFAKEYVTTKECNYGGCAEYCFVRGDLVSLNLRHFMGRSTAAPDDVEVPFPVGAKIEARYGGGEQWFAGKVTGVQPDGKVTITYDDGDKEDAVDLTFVRK
jgi:hypothetical protein